MKAKLIHLAPEGAYSREVMGGQIDRGTPSGVFFYLGGRHVWNIN